MAYAVKCVPTKKYKQTFSNQSGSDATHASGKKRWHIPVIHGLESNKILPIVHLSQGEKHPRKLYECVGDNKKIPSSSDMIKLEKLNFQGEGMQNKSEPVNMWNQLHLWKKLNAGSWLGSLVPRIAGHRTCYRIWFSHLSMLFLKTKDTWNEKYTTWYNPNDYASTILYSLSLSFVLFPQYSTMSLDLCPAGIQLSAMLQDLMISFRYGKVHVSPGPLA